MQLASVEVLLNVAERIQTPAAVARAESEYESMTTRFLSRVTDYERELIEGQVAELESRLAQLSAR